MKGVSETSEYFGSTAMDLFNEVHNTTKFRLGDITNLKVTITQNTQTWTQYGFFKSQLIIQDIPRQTHNNASTKVHYNEITLPLHTPLVLTKQLSQLADL